jgi:hypothetical protein
MLTGCGSSATVARPSSSLCSAWAAEHGLHFMAGSKFADALDEACEVLQASSDSAPEQEPGTEGQGGLSESALRHGVDVRSRSHFPLAAC